MKFNKNWHLYQFKMNWRHSKFSYWNLRRIKKKFKEDYKLTSKREKFGMNKTIKVQEDRLKNVYCMDERALIQIFGQG